MFGLPARLPITFKKTKIKTSYRPAARSGKEGETIPFDYGADAFRETVKYKTGASTWNRKKKLITEYIEAHSKSGGKVLELGCGEVPVFEKSFKVDIAKLPGLDLVHDLNSPLPIDGKFDVIVALEVIGHLWNVDGFLKECVRLLGQDGVLILSSLNVKYWKTRLQLLAGDDSRFDENGYYFWYFSPRSLLKKLQEHGFEADVVRPIGRVPFVNLAERFICICRRNAANS